MSQPPQFAPSVVWKFVATTAVNASALVSALTKRLTAVHATSFVFLYNSWETFGLSGGLLPGVYAVSFTVATWYQRNITRNVSFTTAFQDLPVITSIQVPPVIRRNAATQISAGIDLS